MAQNNKNNLIPKTLPLLPVRDVIIFPFMVLPLVVGREKSQKALETAMAGNRLIFLATQKKYQTEDPVAADIYEIGTIAEVLQLLKMPDGSAKILIEGLVRARFSDFKIIAGKNYVEVNVEKIEVSVERTPNVEALMRQTIHLFEQYIGLNPRLPFETITALN